MSFNQGFMYLFDAHFHHNWGWCSCSGSPGWVRERDTETENVYLACGLDSFPDAKVTDNPDQQKTECQVIVRWAQEIIAGNPLHAMTEGIHTHIRAHTEIHTYMEKTNFLAEFFFLPECSTLKCSENKVDTVVYIHFKYRHPQIVSKCIIAWWIQMFHFPSLVLRVPVQSCTTEKHAILIKLSCSKTHSSQPYVQPGTWNAKCTFFLKKKRSVSQREFGNYTFRMFNPPCINMHASV